MNELIEYLEGTTGFAFDEKRRKDIFKIMTHRSGQIKMQPLEKYCHFVRSSDGEKEINELIDAVTVKETYFFRNENHFMALREHVLPRLLKSGRGLKIWSAGCATGEEAYSLAISLRQALSPVRGWAFEILATDISNSALEKAKSGIYTANSFRGTEEYIKDRYFIKNNQTWEICDEIKKMVSFKRFNLADPNDFSSDYRDIDLILCRNVLMYFRPEIYKKIIRSFAECMREDGFLFLGHVEGSMARETVFHPVKKNGTIFFRKKSFVADQRKIDALSLLKKPDRKKEKKPDRKKQRKTVRQVINPIEGGTLSKNDYLKALDAYFQENYKLAREYIINHDPDQAENFKALLLSSLISLNLLDYKWFEKCLEDLLRISDVAAEVFMVKAIYKESLQEFESAIKANKAAIFADKNFFVPHFRLGHLLEKKGEMEKSRRHFKNALNLIDRDNHERIRLFTGDVSRALLSDICKRRLINGTRH